MTKQPNSNIREIVVIENGESRTVALVAGKSLSIGRSPDSGISLATQKASRHHADIVSDGEIWRLVDRGSVNGTLLNGEKVESASLRIGDCVQIGEAQLYIGGIPSRSQTPPPGEKKSGPSLVRVAPLQGASRSSPHGSSRGAPGSGQRPVDALLTILLLGLLALVIREYVNPTVVSTGTVGDGSRPVTLAPPNGDSPATELPSPAGSDPAADALTMIEGSIRGARSGWEAIEELRMVSEQYPRSEASKRAREWVALLEGMRTADSKKRRELFEDALVPLIRDERFGEALTVARFLSGLDSLSLEREYWSLRSGDIELLAKRKLDQLEKEISALLDAGLRNEALRAVSSARPRFWGIDAFETILSANVMGIVSERTARSRRAISSGEFSRLISESRKALEECRYGELSLILHRAVSLDVPATDRVEALEGLVRAQYLERMFEEFLEKVSGGKTYVDFDDGFRALVVRANAAEVELETSIAGGKVLDRRPWSQLSPLERLRLFRAVPHSVDGLLGIAFLAEYSGNTEAFEQILLSLHRGEAGRALAEAILDRGNGGIRPPGGYVEYKGRLISAAERDRRVDDVRLKKQREREAIAEMKRLKKSSRIEMVVAYVKTLREQGSFELADNFLRQVIEQADDAEQSAEARRLLQDPLLAFRRLEENGRPSNRVDFFILGEGYPVDDEYQEAFLNSANTCKKLLFSVDPYREYESYFNVTALQLGSPDSGIDRIPGDVEKDTPLDAGVRWQILTCNSSKVFSFTRRFPEAGKDRQAIVICNDYADVATGGGGVSTLSKAGLSVVNHEVGHSLAGLRDEYDYVQGTDPERELVKKREMNVPTSEARPNLMRGSDREDVLSKTFWDYWIDAGEEKWWNHSKVSIFEGGDHTPFNVWRPQMGCMMRDGSGFCVVCMEKMIWTIYRYVSPIDRVEPEPGDIEIKAGEEVVLKVWPMQPRTHDLEVAWTILSFGAQKPVGAGGDGGESASGRGRTRVIDGREAEAAKRVASGQDPSGRTLHAAQFRGKDLDPGWHRVVVEVKDPTIWVIRDEKGLLRDSREWWIHVEG